MTNSERRISYLEQVVAPPGEALPDTEILVRFARAMGFRGFDFANASEIFDEWARMTAGTNVDISGLSHDLLRSHGSVQWPFPRDPADERAAATTVPTAVPTTADTDGPLRRHGKGTSRLFTDRRFHTPDGRARLFPVRAGVARSEPTSAEFPLVLTTGRLRDQWHTMTKTGKVRRLKQHAPRPFLEIHPDDADARGIRGGDPVRVWNPRGEVRVQAEVTTAVRPGSVFLPMHWGRLGGDASGRANNLTANRVDPVSKEPDFKFSAVQVARAGKPRERIVVVGAGAAAYRFVHAYRALDREDEMHVFSDEPHPFYDRVRLPEYANENLGWEELLKFAKGELEGLDLHLHPSTPIRAVNRERRTVTDDQGREHPYDKLVAATGSRAFVPPGSPVGEPGIFTLRKRSDADGLKAHLEPGARVLVIGGGLLGLELAAALTEVGHRLTIVELGGRLMERQLDAIAADLLLEFVEEMGVVVHLNDQVQDIRREDTLVVTLESGPTFVVDAVVMAIGTRPNTDLLADAGVECGRGVLVDDHLRTSDPEIYAMGEVAEHRGLLHGITAAAEEQAEVVARHIAGDPLVTYEGSVRMNVLKFSDLDLCSIGIPVAPAGEDGYEEIVLLDRAEQHYKKCIIKDDRLVGAILMGDKIELAEFRELVANELELSDRRKELLRSGLGQEPVLGRLICSCNRVGDGNIREAIASGCDELPEICARTGAGVGCGSCKPEILRILEREAASPVAELEPEPAASA
jgi:ferredoxin-nitrate reductase